MSRGLAEIGSATEILGNAGPVAANAAPMVEAADGSAPKNDPSIRIANGATAEIRGPSAQSVTFAGSTGALKLDDATAFKGQISGLAGADAIDLANIGYGANTQATFLGNTTGGTLTVTDGSKTAKIALEGDYLSSTWTLSSDGKGGTIVVDPPASTNWQTLKVGGGGWVRPASHRP